MQVEMYWVEDEHTLADLASSLVASRYNVSVQAGQTLDIGSLGLAICPPTATTAPFQDEVQDDLG